MMTKREAALILGVREYAPQDRIKEQHRRLMIANHPDSGGSGFIAAKVNEAKVRSACRDEHLGSSVE